MFPPYLYRFFHKATKARSERGFISIPEDRELWPQSWKEPEYKEYNFKEAINLPPPSTTSFIKLLKIRRSLTDEDEANEVTVSKLSDILYAGTGITNSIKQRRTIPSGGTRYPLELYYISFRTIEGLGSGAYHYNIKEHSLENLKVELYDTKQIGAMLTYEKPDKLNGIICITLVFSRTAQKYGSLGYRFAHIEAGHLAQNMILSALDSNILLRPYLTIDEKIIESELNIQNQHETIIYTCLV